MKINWQQKGIRFAYIHNVEDEQFDIVTVAYRFNDERKQLEIAISGKNKNDQFVKQIGRNIAGARLLEGNFTTVSYEALGGATYANINTWIQQNYAELAHSMFKQYAGAKRRASQATTVQMSKLTMFC